MIFLKTVGFVIGHKENEVRRAILPSEIKKISHPEMIYVERGYGYVYGCSDDEYIEAGCNIVSRQKAFECDIICDPKIGDAEYLEELKAGQTIFGWVHAVQNRDITDKIINAGLSAYAWEDMFCNGRHTFFRNNELAGEAAVMHAFRCYGKMPYGLEVAVVGNGNTARGAIKILTMLGSNITCYSRRTEELFKSEMTRFDVIVNCILWDTDRTDHIIYKDDLKKLKKNALIIDISCDRNGGIETSIPTTIEEPVYTVDGVMHYVVDHTPSIFHKDATKSISEAVAVYVDQLINETPDDTLMSAKVFDNGKILDERINRFQSR